MGLLSAAPNCGLPVCNSVLPGDIIPLLNAISYWALVVAASFPNTLLVTKICLASKILAGRYITGRLCCCYDVVFLAGQFLKGQVGALSPEGQSCVPRKVIGFFVTLHVCYLTNALSNMQIIVSVPSLGSLRKSLGMVLCRECL